MLAISWDADTSVMPGKRARQFDDVASVERQLLHPPIVNQAGHRRRCAFRRARPCRTRRRFPGLTEVHPEVDAQVFAGRQLGLRLLASRTR